MLTYIVRRILAMIPTMFGVTVVTYLVMALAPGDPLVQQLSGEGNQSESTNRETYLIQKRELHLDRPGVFNFHYFEDFQEKVKVAAFFMDLASPQQGMPEGQHPALVAYLEKIRKYEETPDSFSAEEADDIKQKYDFLKSIPKLDIKKKLGIDDRDFQSLSASDKKERDNGTANAVNKLVPIYVGDVGDYAVPAALDALNNQELPQPLQFGIVQVLNAMVPDPFLYSLPEPVEGQDQTKQVEFVQAVWEAWAKQLETLNPEADALKPLSGEEKQKAETFYKQLTSAKDKAELQKIIEKYSCGSQDQENPFKASNASFYLAVIKDNSSSYRDKQIASLVLKYTLGKPLIETANRFKPGPKSDATTEDKEPKEEPKEEEPKEEGPTETEPNSTNSNDTGDFWKTDDADSSSQETSSAGDFWKTDDKTQPGKKPDNDPKPVDKPDDKPKPHDKADDKKPTEEKPVVDLAKESLTQLQLAKSHWQIFGKFKRSKYEYQTYQRILYSLSDTQYWHLTRRLVTFQFGESAIRPRELVSNKIWRALKTTAPIMFLAQIIIYLIAVPRGFVCAVNRSGVVDRVTSLFLFMLYSVPVFVAGMLSLVFFAYGDFFSWFPLDRLHSIDADQMDQWEYIKDYAHHLVLPVLCLSLFALAQLAMFSRTSVLDTITKDFVRTAKAKGVPGFWVVAKHTLRNSLIPIVTIFASFIPAMLGGSVLIEFIFEIPGMGKLSLDSIFSKDYPTVMALIYINAIVVLISILLSDLLYVLIDPRISLEGGDKAK